MVEDSGLVGSDAVLLGDERPPTVSRKHSSTGTAPNQTRIQLRHCENLKLCIVNFHS